MRDRTEMRKGDRTRTDLIVACARFLAAQPLERLTVSAICKSAGVAHGTFYLYFSDRNVLAGAVLSAFADYVQLRMHAASRNTDDPAHDTTAAYMRIFEDNAGLMKSMVVGGDAFPQAREAFQRLNHDWAQTVMRATLRRDGRAARPEPDLMRRAYALGGMVDQYLTALFITNDPWVKSFSHDHEAVLEMFTDIWKRGMAP
ncbi:Bacterial regulatory proteins, tetR family [Thalassovita gelatinovora]|uniref:Bacterial regulatory proteins, tetR family n=1 Tax=Thalassovita gelatinovora TaxID=53501 RepID=A0A0P1FUL8_THAGE|nr:TetR/AcrR family transcriptional regulator [Thalassovita gelatinovora]QIZ80069.1 TetR/AcrR family transcriptional regulator [Thalassovita gelatinovora]CUH65483.1 Bacterial regulatory proteins, tetR family [Thalassovita gelatinovora]SER08941.1 transcriptional regulator, TetR family [Thalassovita gelatinovora]